MQPMRWRAFIRGERGEITPPVVRIPYMRWSSAYMYAGLSRLQYALSDAAPAA